MTKTEIAARLYLAGGQCGRCQRAVWNKGKVIGCDLGPGESPILAALLYQLAQAKGARPCAGRVVIKIQPDAYLAKDA